jgi:uncharacterized protein (DUF1697 family)
MRHPMTRPSRFVAFLRAINVGGHTVTMATLRGHFEALGLSDVETFIASGNMIFTASSKDRAALQQRIEDRLHRSLGFEVKTFLRTDAEVTEVARYQPFDAAQLKTAFTHNVAFLAQPVNAAAAKTVMALTTDIDDFHVNGREVYWLCKVGQGDSTFSNAVFEKVLKTRATWRGIKTVARLAAKYGG